MSRTQLTFRGYPASLWTLAPPFSCFTCVAVFQVNSLNSFFSQVVTAILPLLLSFCTFGLVSVSCWNLSHGSDPSLGLPLWAAWSRLILVPPSKYCASCAAWLPCSCVEGWWLFAFVSSFSLWHQRPGPVRGIVTLYTTVKRRCVVLRCRTEVFIFDVPGPPLDVC